VVAVPGISRILQRRGRRIVAPGGGAGQEQIDRIGDQLDVTELFGGDVGHQIVKRAHFLATAEVERLVRVVHEGRHLAELSAQQLLHGGGGIGRWVLRMWQLSLELVKASYHVELSVSGSKVRRTSMGRT
jgi:hypothetical protein